jgi:F-type H+-transporting ATPase subunit delta
MKTTERQYAQALFELTKGKNQEEVDDTVLKFAEELKRERKMKSVGRIIEKFEEIYNRENGIVVAEVVSAKELNEEQAGRIVEFVKKKYEAQEVVVNQKIDKNVVGGIVLRVGDDVIDGSVKGRLNELKSQLEK